MNQGEQAAGLPDFPTGIAIPQVVFRLLLRLANPDDEILIGGIPPVASGAVAVLLA